MRRWEALTQFLKESESPRVVLSFVKIESPLGGRLPGRNGHQASEGDT